MIRPLIIIPLLSLGCAAPALAQMQEGSFSGTYSSYGTFKANPLGKERVLTAWDENGVTLANGFTDHMTWHCWGLANVIPNGAYQGKGYCIATDLQEIRSPGMGPHIRQTERL
jgi:hypothetical protein